MSQRAIVLTGLGWGDECKGEVTHWLADKFKAHTVIRTGGGQAFHRVVAPSGKDHIHSHFGSGTLRGSATHLSCNMVLDPNAILNEGFSLRNEFGIPNIFDLMTIHSEALVVTPFHAFTNQINELLRGENRKGTVGIGIGEAIRDMEEFGPSVIRAKHLNSPKLKDMLIFVRDHKKEQLKKVLSLAAFLPANDRKKVQMQVRNLESDSVLEWTVKQFNELARLVRIVDTNFVSEKILGINGTVIFEGSQGVLLDRWHGFHPYTTQVRTVPQTAFSVLQSSHYKGTVKSYGILRAYHTRHGGGPFVAESESLTKQLPDVSNGDSSWQGKFRVGVFDLVAAKYALEVARICTPVDGLILTCLDRIVPSGIWPVCDYYVYPGRLPESSANNFHLRTSGRLLGECKIDGIKTSTSEGSKKLVRQEEISNVLTFCSPHLSKFIFGRRSDLAGDADLCRQFLERELAIPVVAASTGTSKETKVEFSKL